MCSKRYFFVRKEMEYSPSLFGQFLLDAEKFHFKVDVQAVYTI